MIVNDPQDGDVVVKEGVPTRQFFAFLEELKRGSNQSTSASTVVNSMAELLLADQTVILVHMTHFHSDTLGADGNFVYSATEPRANHTGGTIIDPTNTADLVTWDAAAKTTWFTPGSGLGCWVRLFSGIIHISWFGYLESDSNNAPTINNAILAAANGSGQGVSGAIQLTPQGTHKTTEGINLIASVSIYGDSTQDCEITPTMSSGNALNASLDSAQRFVFNQTFREFSINCTGLTGTARALHIKNGNRTVFDQVNINRNTNVNDSVPTMLIEGAGYGLRFNDCHFTNNKEHWLIRKIGTGSDFPTAILFDHCIFEEAQQANGFAMRIVDSSGITLRNCTVQENLTLITLGIERTADQVTSDNPRIIGGWWEDNGNGQAGSIGIDFNGLDATDRILQPVIRDVNFHQSVVKKPEFQINAEWTDGLEVTGCYSAGVDQDVRDGGNNINYFVDHRQLVGPVGLKTAIVWASANFDGKTSITINNNNNFDTIVRNSIGNYTLTFLENAPAINYIVHCNAEDGSLHSALICSHGDTTSVSSFGLFVLDDAGNLTDGRNVSVEVKSYPA